MARLTLNVRPFRFGFRCSSFYGASALVVSIAIAAGVSGCGSDGGTTAPSRCKGSDCAGKSGAGGEKGSGGAAGHAAAETMAGGAGSGSGGRDAGAGGEANDAQRPVDAGRGHPPPPDPSKDACTGGDCPGECGPGLTLCEGACVDLKTSTAHCGACGHSCGTAGCEAGNCGDCTDTGPIGTLPAKLEGVFAGATDRVSLSCGRNGAPDQTYSFTAPETGDYVFGTPGADTAIALFDGCGGAEVACEKEATRYSTTLFVGKGKTVRVAIEAGSGTQSFALKVRRAAPDACCESHETPGCGNPAIEACVCAVASGCCTGKWNATCDALVNSLGCGFCELDRPPSCGETECSQLDDTATFLGVGQCCTSNGECGAALGGQCQARDQHGTADRACASERVANIRADGCCRTDNRCGVDLSTLGMGCVAREEAPGVSLKGATCGSGSTSLPDYQNFESDQVRPLALSPDGKRLFAVNTPDDRLEVFDITDSGLSPAASVPVGLEPVAVAARTATEVWVVNQVSDSVSIVDLASTPPRVARTLWVGDEPRDIVFAGPGSKRAFITTAHRGQNSPVDPALLTPGTARADVWVFDSERLGPALGGAPSTVLSFFGDTPRGLAVSPDGSTVYAAVYHSGNRTTIINQASIDDRGLPPPIKSSDGVQQPSVGLIVQFDGKEWVDELGRSWSDKVRFSLPDYDVFAIDANANPPAAGTRFSGVGTTLFNLAVNPKTAAVYVSNTNARNAERFEPTVRARSTESRITVIKDGAVTPRDLNPHIDTSIRDGSDTERNLSLGLPTGMTVSPDGTTIFLAALGSSKVGLIDAAALEAGTYSPAANAQVTVAGGGPTGLVLDTAHGKLYVHTRFDNGISTIDVGTRAETAHVLMPNPEPAIITGGRPFLYDTLHSSAHGDHSCASCHAFGDTDHLAWDLGDPGGKPIPNNNPGGGGTFHPMKGPMATQSLRGMRHAGPMHWRGDRSGARDPGGDFADTDAGFHQFNGAFVTLLGRQTELSAPQMQAFTDFVLTLTYPPNPLRALDDSLTAAQKRALDIYMHRNADFIATCNGCHALDPAAGFFGADGRTQFDGEPQTFKVPHLRNAYQKVGMFGMSAGLGVNTTPFTGEQIRGFGYIHDGSVDTLFDFLSTSLFSLSAQDKNDLASLLLAFDSTMAPAVGQQVTLDATTAASGRDRYGLLVQQGLATVPRRSCDLVGHGVVAGEMRGYVLRSDGKLDSDRAAEAPLAATAMLDLAASPGNSVTFTCMPPGSGVRAGIDRDRDGKRDRDELDHGTDPATPTP
jgi:DNA-binding beta-propeller fold protein YncE